MSVAQPNDAAARAAELAAKTQQEGNAAKALLMASVSTMVATLNKRITELQLEAKTAEQLAKMLKGTAVADVANKYSTLVGSLGLGGSLSDVMNV